MDEVREQRRTLLKPKGLLYSATVEISRAHEEKGSWDLKATLIV